MKIWETSPQSTSAAIEAFLAGQDVVLDTQLLSYELYGSMAHAMGLERIGILSPDEVAQIKGVLESLLNQKIELKPQDEDVHSFLEAYLTKELGEVGEKIHTGRSRNDQVLVDLRLYAKDQLQQIALQSLALIEVLLELAQEHKFVPMPGTTHTRFAMPSSIGLWASSFAEGLLETLIELSAAHKLVNRSPLGSSAGYGVPLPLEREYVAELLGFESAQINSLNIVSSRGKIDFAVISALASIMLDLGRLSTDLIWGSSEKFQFFEIPSQFCTGSSIMPNKHNPDVLELIRAKAAGISGDLVQVFTISQGQISGYHRDHQELKGALMTSTSTTRAALNLMTELVKGLKVNASKLKDAHTPELYAVDQMIEQVKGGKPLRSAYRAVKENLDEIAMPDFVEALKSRSHLGGPGNLALDQLGDMHAAERSKWTERREHFQTRLAGLLSAPQAGGA